MDDRARKMDLAAVLATLRARGVEFGVDEGRLSYSAPRGALSADDLQKLRHLKPEILAYLQPSATQSAAALAPLTFAQLWDWNRWATGKPRYRTVHTAIRLSGPLRMDCLEHSLRSLVERHESLRTRVIRIDGEPFQEVSPAQSFNIEVIDTAAAEAQVEASTLALVEQPIDAAVDPLFVVRVVKLSDREHILIVVLDHLISDQDSINVLLTDVFTMYAHLTGEGPKPKLYPPVQIADYAVWQRRETESWTQQHGPYWNERLAGAPTLSVSGRSVSESRSRAKAREIEIGTELTTRLRELSRRAGTTACMGFLTAYAATLAHWCETSDLLIPFISSGRSRPELRTTIGRLVYPLFLRIQIADDDTYMDLLAAVTREFGNALAHRDSGRIAARPPLARFALNPSFNWIAESDSTSDDILAASSRLLNGHLNLSAFPVHEVYGRIEVDIDLNPEPVIVFRDDGLRISGILAHLEARLSEGNVLQFLEEFRLAAETLADAPQRQIFSHH